MTPSPYDKKIASFLKKRRGEMTIRDFAKIAGMSKSALFRIENLEQSMTMASLHSLAQRLRTSVEEILGFKK